MEINVTDLKKELFKEETLNVFKEKVLERFTVSQIKKWNKENWELEILGTLGFSLSSIVADFLELNRNFFENNTDYKWDVYIDRVLDSFVNGKCIDPFKDIECEPFFNAIKEVVDVLDNKFRRIPIKNQRKYVGIPSLEEIKEQHETILNLAKDVVTFNQVKELAEKYSKTLEIEVNWEPLSYYKGEEIEIIRYDYKNLLVYVNIEDGKAIPDDFVTLYSDDGLQFKDAHIDKIEEEIESAYERGFLVYESGFLRENNISGK